jgi:multidrug transporter EmrE-like cation transporter
MRYVAALIAALVLKRYVAALIAALVLNATANLLIKAAARSIEDSGGLLSGGVVAAARLVATNWLFIVGVICFGLNLLAYLYSLQRLDISLAYPIMVSCGYAIIVVVARFMGERLAAAQWVGIGLMLVGVWLVGTSVKAGPRPTGPTETVGPQDTGQAAR